MAYREGVDYSGTHPGGAALKAAGKTFVVRYTPYNNVAKGITKSEIADLRSHGISIAMVFEMFANNALRGYSQGVADARLAQEGIMLVGLPSNLPIYFAVDWDASSGQQAAIDSYLKGAAAVLGAYRVGVYGGYNVIARCYANKTARWFWQTYAWSGGKLHPAAHLYQYNIYAHLNGVAVDLNRALKTDFGQYPRPSTPAPAPAPKPVLDKIDGDMNPMRYRAYPSLKSLRIRSGKPVRTGVLTTSKTLATTSEATPWAAFGFVPKTDLPLDQQKYGDVYVGSFYKTNGHHIGYVKAVDVY